jgi:hypothetical protein
MANWEDVRRLALALPGTSERVTREQLAWWVGKSLFVWERPLRGPDLKAFGALAPSGPILGVRVEDEGEKHALIAERPEIYFTTPHFDGYPAVLVQLDVIGSADLEARIIEAWLARAPARLLKDYLSGTSTEGAAERADYP